MLCWGRCLNGKMTVNKVIFWYGKYINVYVPSAFNFLTASEMDICQSTESCCSLLSEGTISSWLHTVQNEEGRLIPLEICSHLPRNGKCKGSQRNCPSWFSLALWILITHFLTFGSHAYKAKGWDSSFSNIISTPEMTVSLTAAFSTMTLVSLFKKKKKFLFSFYLALLNFMVQILVENLVEISLATFRRSNSLESSSDCLSTMQSHHPFLARAAITLPSLPADPGR